MFILKKINFSFLSLLIGLGFFAFSLTPSLIPRDNVLQGVLGGIVIAIGYGVGRLLRAVWDYLELPVASDKPARWLSYFVGLPVLGFTLWSLSNAGKWQDSIRARMGMPEVSDTHWLSITLIAAAVFLVFFLIGWAISVLFDLLRIRLHHLLPKRVANVLGFSLLVIVLLSLGNKYVVGTAFKLADETYSKAALFFDADTPPPTDALKSGSAASLIGWGAMGQRGRDYVDSGPTAASISAFTGSSAKEPLRIYVGLENAESAEERAQLAVAEMKRVGAFDRKVLVIAMPTGTGWLDPSGFQTLEYLHHGDVATVAVQYSYLSSPLTLVFETQTGRDQAIALMDAVYGYWAGLSPAHRPRLYLHGLSLGSWSSMASLDLAQMIGDPIQGALWVGPPFPSELWRRATSRRNVDSPYVLPVVGEEKLVRFANQTSMAKSVDKPWGPMRIFYLQHASDAIVFYEPEAAWRRPAWMREPVAFDVSPYLRWVPIVTMLQLAVDMAIATAVPMGFGHNYSADNYIDGWVAVTEPDGWTPETIARLKAYCNLGDLAGCKN